MRLTSEMKFTDCGRPDAGTEAVSPDELKKICLLVPEFRADGKRSGGLDAVAQFVLDAFSPEDGWRVSVASPRMWHLASESRQLLRPRSWLRSTARDVMVDGVKVRYFGSNIAEFEPARYWPRRALTAYLESFEAVLVVAGSPAIINVAKHSGRPVIAQVATLIAEERKALLARTSGLRRLRVEIFTRLVARIDERALRVADVVIVENEFMLEVCRSRGLNAELIAPGVNCEIFRPPTVGVRAPTILAVGRWRDERKDLPTLLRAFARSHEVDGIDQRLALAGLQAPRDDDLALIRELGVEQYVDIYENLPTAELAELYRRADLFALTSTEEGLGIVFLEAMASGTPVVATATEGAQFALGESGAGELIDFGPELVARFSAALTRWCCDEDRRIKGGVIGRANVQERFDSRRAGARFRSVVEAAVNGTARASVDPAKQRMEKRGRR